MKRLLLAATGLISLAIGCHESGAPDDPRVKRLPTTQVVIREKTYNLEIADDPQEQATGLMYRTKVGDSEGMIFVFPDEQVRGFWMQNVPISLDIAYLDHKGVVLNVLTMYPMDTRTRSSEVPAQYAIELAGGAAKKIGLKPGDTIILPDAIKPKP